MPLFGVCGDLELQAQLDRLGVTFRSAGVGDVACVDFDGDVWFLGPMLTGRRWYGPLAVAVARLHGLADGAGPEGFWHALDRG